MPESKIDKGDKTQLKNNELGFSGCDKSQNRTLISRAISWPVIYRGEKEENGKDCNFDGTQNWRKGFLIPNFCIRDRRVLGLSPRMDAAPRGPSTTPLVFLSTF